MTFWKLTLVEIKHHMKSIIFYIFIIAMLLFYSTQYYNEVTRLQYPSQDSVYASVEAVTDNEKLLLGYKQLYGIFTDEAINKYIPVSKSIKLNDEQLQDLKAFLDQMAPDANVLELQQSDIIISYPEMISYMDSLDHKFGGDTSIGENYRQFLRPMTYDEALIEHQAFTSSPTITDCHARLLYDYMGIFAGIFVVFLSTFSLLRDRHSGSIDFIYSSKVKASTYVAAKFTGLFLCIMGAFACIALLESSIFLYQSITLGIQINAFAFFKYLLLWIAPTVMFSIIFPMFLSILFDNAIVPIVLHSALSLNLVYMNENYGIYGLGRFIIRFNLLDSNLYYQSVQSSIMMNRLFYVFLSLFLLAATSKIWAMRRNQVTTGGIAWK